MAMARPLLLLLILSLLSQDRLLAQTAAASEDPRVGKTLIAEVEGVYREDRTLDLTIRRGPAATNAVRLFSEPSHTLLAVLIDSEYLKTSSGAAFLSAAKSQGRPRIATSPLRTDSAGNVLPSTTLIKGVHRPPSDDSLVLWVNSKIVVTRGLNIDSSPSEEEHAPGDQRVSTTELEAGKPFHFASYYDPATLTAEYCCVSPDCGIICTSCDTRLYNCCTMPYWKCCCLIHCPPWRCTDCC